MSLRSCTHTHTWNDWRSAYYIKSGVECPKYKQTLISAELLAFFPWNPKLAFPGCDITQSPPPMKTLFRVFGAGKTYVRACVPTRHVVPELAPVCNKVNQPALAVMTHAGHHTALCNVAHTHLRVTTDRPEEWTCPRKGPSDSWAGGVTGKSRDNRSTTSRTTTTTTAAAAAASCYAHSQPSDMEAGEFWTNTLLLVVVFLTFEAWASSRSTLLLPFWKKL